MRRAASIATLATIIMWLALTGVFITVLNEILSEASAVGAPPTALGVIVAVGMILITSFALWIWWEKRTKLRGQLATLGLVIGLTITAILVVIITAASLMLISPSVPVHWLQLATIFIILSSLVSYKLVKVVSQIPFIAIILTFALFVWLVIISVMTVAFGTGIGYGLNLGGYSINVAYYAGLLAVGMLVINTCSGRVWLPKLSVAGLQPGWFRPLLIALILIVAFTGAIPLAARYLVSLLPPPLPLLLIPAEMAIVVVGLLSYQKLPGVIRALVIREQIEVESTADSPWFDPRASEWLQVFSRRIQSQIIEENRGVHPATDDWFNGWYARAHISKLFLPSNFVAGLRYHDSEGFACLRLVIDKLSVQTTRAWRIIKIQHIGNYKSDLDYQPREFQDETVRIATTREETVCSSCEGNGVLPCPTTQRCYTCGGSGRSSCWSCSGSGSIVVVTNSSDRGAVWTGSVQSYTTYVRCSSCSGSGNIPCHANCNNGDVVCSACGGTGRKTCEYCDGAGSVIKALVTTKIFTHSVDVNYQLENMPPNQFKRGLKASHFKKMQGVSVHEEMQNPMETDTVRQKMLAIAFYVHSCIYTYNDKTFILNHIHPSKYVPVGLPWSKRRVALAIGTTGLLVAAIAASLAWLL